MKLLFIRHGEPNYAKDCLTENGIRQAELLAQRLRSEKITAAFMSPMGRAKETAHICVDGTGIPLRECDWLHEFDVKIHGTAGKDIEIWDLDPRSRNDRLLFDRSEYCHSPLIEDTQTAARAAAAADGIDGILAEYGLIREGDYFRKTADCEETLVFFCHFGITCAVTAYLLGISPILLLTGMSAEPTAVAVLCTDDRFGKYVNFRLHGYGDISHLEERSANGINYR